MQFHKEKRSSASSGGRGQLPQEIEALAGPPKTSEEEGEAALALMDHLLRTQLLQVSQILYIPLSHEQGFSKSLFSRLSPKLCS